MRETLGKYQLLTPLSVGGMAELHLACMPGPGGFRKFVALKQILPDIRSDETFVKMFLDEARLTAALTHPNIGQVFDLGQEDGELYLAMEFIAGVNLSQVLTRVMKANAQPPAGFACRVVRDVCLALQQAHSFKDPATGQPMPIVHRDVAPKNIMVTFDGVVKVIDFGIAKSKGRLARTQVGLVRGTVPYMSPEQLQDLPLDGRSDIYSLGVVLWEFLTGRRLHAPGNDLETMERIIRQDAPPPSSVAKVSPALDAVVAQALARDPKRRFGSARELARALEQACPQRFNEEQLGGWLSKLFPETQVALSSLLAAAQHDDAGAQKELTVQVRKLRRADASSTDLKDATPPPPPPPTTTARGPRPHAQGKPPTPSRPATSARGVAPRRTAAASAVTEPRAPLPGNRKLVVAVGAAVVVLLLGAGALALFGGPGDGGAEVVQGLTIDPTALRPGDEQLADGARAREVDLSLQQGEFDRALALLSLCVKDGSGCRQSRVLLDEVRLLAKTKCSGGQPALEVLKQGWALLQQRKWSPAREALNACRYERAVSFRVGALTDRINKEAQYDALLGRAEALVGAAQPTLADLEEARGFADSAKSTLVSAGRLKTLLESIEAKRPAALERAQADQAAAAAARAEEEKEAAAKAAAAQAEQARLAAEEAAKAAALSRTPAQREAIEQWVSRARDADTAGRTKEAILHLEQCTRRFPDEPDCLVLLGDAYVKQGSASRNQGVVAKGLTQYRTFLKVAPREHEAFRRTRGLVDEYDAQRRALR